MPNQTMFTAKTKPFYHEQFQTWNVFSYADVLRVLTDADTFSQEYHARMGALSHLTYDAMWARDGKPHADLRGLVNEPFSTRRLRALEPEIRAIAVDRLEVLLRDHPERIEFAAYARTVSNRIICRILGVDVSYDTQFAYWAEEFSRAMTLNQLPQQDDLVAFLAQVLEDHRRNPGQGLVDDLLRAEREGKEIAGRPLDERDLLAYVFSLLFAGSETTGTSLGNMMVAFVEHEGVLEELRHHPTLRPTAIEESLRWRTSFPTVILWAQKDVVLSGETIAAGQAVTTWIPTANFDPDQFANPERFDIRRQPNLHLGFGWGRHKCLGAPLARLEMSIVLDVLLDGLPSPVVLDSRPVYDEQGIINTLKQVYFRLPAKQVVMK